MSGDLSEAVKQIVAGRRLREAEAANAVAEIMRGEAEPAQIAGFLTGLAMREPVVAEITGAAKAMRAAMTTITAPPSAIDMCGTGGDGHNTLNISTAASLIVAACGVPVAKHGNRGASSKSGTADVLEALGIAIDAPPAAAERSLAETHFAFLFAPSYHPAMRHVAPVRKALGFRTLFNLLGPLANPAGVKRQLLGVPSQAWVETLCRVLRDLGTETAMVVHGSDGLDELTTTGPALAAILEDGHITMRQIAPEEIGAPRATLAELIGGNARHNAAALAALLSGQNGPFRDVAVLNAAAGLLIAGRAGELAQGADLARAALDTGSAAALLRRLAVKDAAA